jgi:hypothetical protein
MVLLKGRPPMGEFLAYVKNSTLDGATAELSSLSQEWRDANDHVLRLEQAEAGHAEHPVLEELPRSVHELADAVLASDVMRQSFGVVPTQLALVELERLVVFQKQINLDHVRRIAAELGNEPNEEDLFNLCLPVGGSVPQVLGNQVAQNAWVFTSPSNDLRLLQVDKLKPAQVSGHPWAGFPSDILGFIVGYGMNAMNAIQVGSRLILNNGSHRAYALRDLGIAKALCIVQTMTRRDELEVIGNQELVQRFDYYASAPRPPLLKDYFDPQLRKLVRVPKRARQVRITYGAEAIDVPAM